MARSDSIAPAEAQPSESTTAQAAVVSAEPAPAISAEALAAQVDRAAAFGATPQGKALTDAEQALYSGIALLGTAISSLENETGERDDVERETETLRIALERLEAARSSLDKATTAAVRS